MRIRNISIKGLFGTFDHEIPLFLREPITIIHGPNGVGKTSILKLVSGTLQHSTKLLRSVPFARLRLHFEDASILEVEPAIALETETSAARRHVGPRPRRVINYRLIRDERVEAEYTHTGVKPPIGRLEHFLPVSRIGPDVWLDSRTNAAMSYEDLIRVYGSELPEELRSGEVPPWLAEIQKGTPVHFIETQRLLSVKAPDPRHPASQESTVKECSAELARRINEILATSATLSQTLERSFPTRLIAGAGTGTGPLSEVEIRAKLNALDQKRSRLVDAGLLEPSNEPTLPAKRFDETTQRVLGVYITDTEEKLAVFDDMLRRIELIRSIVDSRFLQKTISISRGEGFSAKTRDGRALDLSGLSSGEQHELVLLYELLFRARPNTLILIDEPELSLHIAWQQQFLRDLLEITKLARLTALVATHSPQIIHDRWDLTVELLGPTR